MTPLKYLYGKRCHTPLCWYDSRESVMLVPEIVQQTNEKINMIQDKMKALQSLHNRYHDKRRKTLEFQEGIMCS